MVYTITAYRHAVVHPAPKHRQVPAAASTCFSFYYFPFDFFRHIPKKEIHFLVCKDSCFGNRQTCILLWQVLRLDQNLRENSLGSTSAEAETLDQN